MGYNTHMTKVDIAGLKIDAITKAELLKQLDERIKTGQKTWVTSPYSEFFHAGLSDSRILDMLNKSDIAVPDGIGLFWAKRFLDIPLTAKSYWGKILQALWQIKYSLWAIILKPKWINSALPEKIEGSNLIWDLAKLAEENNFSIYLLGGFGDTPKLVSDKLQVTSHRLRIAGCSNKNIDDATVIEDINKAAPDMLFVAYSPIAQEKWIQENLPKLRVKMAIGLGGTFDYIAGVKVPPPKFVRKIGLEWLWRLLTQPKRYKRIFNATYGLSIRLWRYKVFMSYPMRKNAAAVILNQENKILCCQRNPKNFHVDIISTAKNLKRLNYWQFPQGGIDRGEDAKAAATREAFEEIGVKSIKFIWVSPRVNSYMWNNGARSLWYNRKHKNPGQNQHIVYFKFFGTKDEIRPDNHEFISYRWADAQELANVIHPERSGLVKIVLENLKEMREKAII